MFRITGKIEGISQVEQGTSQSGNQWKRCSLVIKEDREYGDSVFITGFNDKADLISAKSKGDVVTALFNVRHRVYNGKVYNDVTLYKFDEPQHQVVKEPEQVNATTNDLPF